MKQIHEMKGPQQQWAKIEEFEGEFHIIDGWNCGQISAAILFPNVSTARYFLAGRWAVPAGEINLVATREIKPELTTDEKIVKLARQLARGMILDYEFLQQMDILIADEMQKRAN